MLSQLRHSLRGWFSHSCIGAAWPWSCLQVFSNKERIANMPGVKQKSQYRQIIDQALQEQMAKVPA
jgi:hypothetical protein